VEDGGERLLATLLRLLVALECFAGALPSGQSFRRFCAHDMSLERLCLPQQCLTIGPPRSVPRRVPTLVLSLLSPGSLTHLPTKSHTQYALQMCAEKRWSDRCPPEGVETGPRAGYREGMMSLRAVHAGTGYRYLLSSVATNDAAPGELGQRPPTLSDYYQAKGTPQGRWIGSGLAGFASETAMAGQEISETQMAALYGEGLHPDADERMRAGESLDDVKIGRAFSIYTGERSVLGGIAQAEKAFRLHEERLPTEDERSTIAEQVGRAHYKENHPDANPSGEDVIAWVNEQRDQVKQAVSGYDFTFSPAKSVSVLWALSDEQTASKIAAIHHRAVADTLEWAEENCAFTRRGTNGIEQIRTRGLIASEFTHFDTRAGDPDLHSHVLVSNKVQGVDGKWRALDGTPIFQMHQSMSARYDVAVQDLL